MPNQSKAVRSALLVARRQRAGGGSLSDAMNSFSQAREAQFNRPASGNSDAALLAALQSQHPQLAVAEAPEQRRESTSQGVGDLGAEIDEGAKWLSGTQDNDAAPVKGKPQGTSGTVGNAPVPQSQPPHPGGPSHSNVDQNSAAMHMMDRLVTQHGWTPAAAAIAAGNAMQESGFQPSVAGDASIPGGSHGYAQWNRDRFANLQGFAKQQGTDWTNPDTQIDFLANEAKSRVPGWSSQSDLSQARPISKAYEGYAVEGNRVPDASKFYDMYQSRPQPQQAQGTVPPPAQPQDTTGGPLSEADPMTNNVDQAKRGGRMMYANGGGLGGGFNEGDHPRDDVGKFADKNTSPGGYSDDYGPNVSRILSGGSRVIRGTVPLQVRRELQAAVKAGVLGHLKKDGLKPEIFFHPDHRNGAIDTQKRHAMADIDNLRKVMHTPSTQEKIDTALGSLGNSKEEAARGGYMRRDHFDDGGSAGDSAATAAGVAAGFGGVGDADGAPAGVSTNSGVTGFAGVGEDGDTGFGSVGYNSPGVNTAGSGGGNTGFGGASSGSGGGANSSGVGVGANSAGAGAAAGNGSGGGGGTAAGGSSNGAGSAGVSGTQNGGNIGVTAQDIYAMLVAAGKQSQINFGGPGGPGSVQSLGVPPGALSGVNTATTPVSVSSLGPPGYSASQVAAINAMMAARGGVGLGGGASPGFGNNGFGGGSSSATVGGFGGNSNSSGAEGVSTAGIGGLGGGPAAVTAPSMEAQLGPAQQAMLAQMRSGVASPSGPPGSAPAAVNAPSVNATNMMGVQGFNVAGPQAAAPAPSAAPQASGATSGRNPQAQNAVEHQNRGGYLQRADGGSVAHIPTNELIEMALSRIRQRRNAANGGSQDLGLSFAALAPRSAGGNQAQYAYNLGLGGLGPAGDINPGSAQGQALQSGQAPAAAAAPAPPNTPAIPDGAVGNHGGYGAVGTSGSPISGVPNASPIGGGYNNTLDQVLGTNNPSMDQIFGFTYPTPPAPKSQPQGPVSQDTINQLSLMGNGAQQFAAGGAIIMDAALNKARKAVKGNKRYV